MTRKTLIISGMNCGHCVMALRSELGAVPDLQVEDVAIGKAVVTFDGERVTLDRIAEAVAEAGFTLETTE